MTSNTFEFSKEDYEKIILKESLFENGTTTLNMTQEDSKKVLKNLYSCETRTFLHAVTLSDYLRQKKIPRGLRIQKSPTIGLNNPAFCEKWCEITNKCSFDLMALLIQELSEQLTQARNQIKEVQDKVNNEILDKEKLKELFAECEQFKEKLEADITSIKKKKFERDAEDYRKGSVYSWRNRQHHRENYGRTNTAPPRLESRFMDTDSETNFSTGSSASSSFLDHGHNRRGQKAGQPKQRDQRSAGGGSARAQGGMRRYPDRHRRRPKY